MLPPKGKTHPTAGETALHDLSRFRSPNSTFPRLFQKLFFLLLLLALFVIPIALVPRVVTLNPAAHSKEFFMRALLVLLSVGFVAALRWLPRRPFDLLEACVAFFVMANIVSCLFSSRPAYCFTQTWHLWIGALLVVAIYRFAPALGELSRLNAILVIAGVLTALYGLLVYFGLDPLRSLYPFAYRKDEGRNYIHSFLGNPEYFGGYMAPLAVLSFSRIFQTRMRLWLRATWVFLVLFFLLALVLSGTRGALLGFLVAAGMILLAEVPRLPRALRRSLVWAAGAMALIVIVLVALFSFPNPVNYRNMRLAQRFQDLANLNSASVRERIFFYSITGRMIADRPLIGSGPGTYRLEFYPYIEKLSQRDTHSGVQLMTLELRKRVAEHAHNDYLEVWSETGTLGLGALLLVVSAALVRFFRGLKPIWRLPVGGEERNAMHSLAAYRTGFGAAFVCIFFNALFSFPLHLPVRASLAWALLGCFLAADYALHSNTALNAGRHSADPVRPVGPV